MAKKKNLTIDTLWKLQRAGAPSLAPDGVAGGVLAEQLFDAGQQVQQRAVAAVHAGRRARGR